MSSWTYSGRLIRRAEVYFALAIVLLVSNAQAAPPCHPNRILLQPRVGIEAHALAHIHQGKIIRTFPGLGGLQVVSLPEGQDAVATARRCQASGCVQFAEPNFRVRLDSVVPSDPGFQDGTLWALHNEGQDGGQEDADIDAPEAWALQKDAPGIVVAIIDTGVRLTHEDLVANLWRNPSDGSHGFNAFDGSHLPTDEVGHGTTLAGIIGAAGDNSLGVVGVCWQVQIMACKFADASGGFIEDAIACLDFAHTNGAHVINASWGLYESSAALSNALVAVRQAGIIVVASAGNDSIDTDLLPYYPASFPFDNVLSVGGTTRSDEFYILYNYGSNSVDLAAPAESIHSTFYRSDEDYAADQGTSVAAAYVSGASALMRARYTAASPAWIVERLRNEGDPLDALAGTSRSGARLNLQKALQTVSTSLSLTLVPVPGPSDLSLLIEGNPDSGFVLESSDHLDGSWTSLLTNLLSPSGSWQMTTNTSTGTMQLFFRARY